MFAYVNIYKNEITIVLHQIVARHPTNTVKSNDNDTMPKVPCESFGSRGPVTPLIPTSGESSYCLFSVWRRFRAIEPPHSSCASTSLSSEHVFISALSHTIYIRAVIVSNTIIICIILYVKKKMEKERSLKLFIIKQYNYWWQSQRSIDSKTCDTACSEIQYCAGITLRVYVDVYMLWAEPSVFIRMTKTVNSPAYFDGVLWRRAAFPVRHICQPGEICVLVH